MKHLLHLLLAVLAATFTLAAPAPAHLQRPLGGDSKSRPGKHGHSSSSPPTPDVGHTTATPLSTHTQPNERPKAFQLPYVVKAPKPGARKHSKHYGGLSLPSLPAWMTPWRKALTGALPPHTPSKSTSASTSTKSTDRLRMHFNHANNAKLACFCAGGAVCCHTSTGLDCNSGYCGL